MSMKKRITISTRQRIISATFITFFLLFSVAGHSQNKNEVSISFYPGFTLLNFEKANGYSSDYLENWSQFNICVAIRGFLRSEKPLQFGAEAAWQRLYYAYYVVPYAPSSVYREFNVSSESLMVLCRYSINNFFAVGGVGIYSFKNGIAPAICLEAGYAIKIGENLKFPVSLRVNPIFGSGTPVPISVGAGMSFAFD
jgi:hypothetical protein